MDRQFSGCAPKLFALARTIPFSRAFSLSHAFSFARTVMHGRAKLGRCRHVAKFLMQAVSQWDASRVTPDGRYHRASAGTQGGTKPSSPPLRREKVGEVGIEMLNSKHKWVCLTCDYRRRRRRRAAQERQDRHKPRGFDVGRVLSHASATPAPTARGENKQRPTKCRERPTKREMKSIKCMKPFRYKKPTKDMTPTKYMTPTKCKR